MNSQNTKQHFEVLDGLRGIAAIAVVVFHYMEFVYTDPSTNFIGHGFLAVDFFFCLSGFVITYAYDNRIKEIGLIAFFKARLIRLHPLVIIAAILGLIAYFITWDASATPHDPVIILLSFLSTALLIPLPIMSARGYSLIAFNSPGWSLFFEYVANIAYALFLYKLTKRFLLLLTLIAAACLVFAAHRSGNLVGGWDGKTFLDGLARVSFSFLAGMLVYRFQLIIKNNLSFIILSVLLLSSFVMPFFSLNWLAEALVIIFFYPLLVATGAGTKLPENLKKTGKFLGDISYPLYMTHYSLIWFFVNYSNKNKLEPLELSFIISIGTLIMIGFAYLIMKLYDLPVRKYLQNRKQ